jgi:hypothetical protein
MIGLRLSDLFMLTQKGIGEEEPTLQARLEEYFNKYGKANAVRMRRDENKKFKVRCPLVGVIFILKSVAWSTGICFCRVCRLLER